MGSKTKQQYHLAEYVCMRVCEKVKGKVTKDVCKVVNMKNGKWLV